MDIAYDSLLVANRLCEDHDGNTEAKSELGSLRYQQHIRPFYRPWNTDTGRAATATNQRSGTRRSGESAVANTVGKTMHGQSGAFAEAMEAMYTLRSPCMHIQPSTNRSGTTYMIHEESHETAEVTSHDSWQWNRRRGGWTTMRGLKGKISHTMLRRMAAWSDEMRECRGNSDV